MQENSCKR